MSRPLCGECPACIEATARCIGRTPAAQRQARPAPTKAELERHAKRFGPEGVLETAEELGVDVAVERPRRKRGARRPTLNARVAELLTQGHGVDVIAEIENLSPSRARRIIKEVEDA